MAARLGYPIDEQHYFSGFVLNRADAAQWRDIEYAIQQSAKRGTAATFVWAQPQVARDGYTHFDIDEEEQSVQPFDDILFPLEIGRQASATPEFSTQIVTTLSGHEIHNSDWADARQNYDVGPGVRSEEELGILLSFFRARRGAARGFRFRDPFDNSSAGMTEPPTALDQFLGTGDGLRTIFPLVKIYGDGGTEERQQRRITRPITASVQIAVDGESAIGWTVDGGNIIFETAPIAGAAITAGFQFDVPVRFAEDRIEVNRFSFGAGEVASVLLTEIKEAA
jgi:uncharacterized protein (TIGR02217 family)